MCFTESVCRGYCVSNFRQKITEEQKQTNFSKHLLLKKEEVWEHILPSRFLNFSLLPAVPRNVAWGYTYVLLIPGGNMASEKLDL